MTNKLKKRFNVRTFVLGANHGQLLQAYGMKCLIEGAFPNSQVSHELHHNHLLKEIAVHCKKGAFIKMISLIFWWLKLINFTVSTSKRDVTVFGADTIWMKDHPIAPNDKFYFGHDIKSGKLCSISASNAGSSYSLGDPIIGNQIECFDFLGVRDRSTSDFVESVSSKKAYITCDPAFFIDEKFYVSKEGKGSRSAVSVYAGQSKKIRDISLNVVPSSVRGEEKWGFRFFGYSPSLFDTFSDQVAGPASVLSQIKNSRLLVTDTFHGVVMALMTKTPFLLIASDIVVARLEGPLLDMFDSRRMIPFGELSSSLSLTWIYDFDDFDEVKLDEYITRSRELVKLHLENIVS